MDGFDIVQERSTHVNLVNRIRSVMQDQVEKHFNKGVDFARCGEYAKAVTSFDMALEIEPDNDMLWVLRGSMLDDLVQYPDALNSYDKALAIKPDYAVAWYNRGVVLRKLGRYLDAIDSFDRALALNPDYADAKKHREHAIREQDTTPEDHKTYGIVEQKNHTANRDEKSNRLRMQVEQQSGQVQIAR